MLLISTNQQVGTNWVKARAAGILCPPSCFEAQKPSGGPEGEDKVLRDFAQGGIVADTSHDTNELSLTPGG